MKRITIGMLILGQALLAGISIAQQELKRDIGSNQTISTINLGALGKPSFSESKNGIKAQIWLLTREEHDRLLAMPRSGQPFKGELSDVDHGKLTPSNPEIAVVVLDDAGGKVPIQNAIVEIITKSSSGKPLTRGLVAAKDHYATNLDFTEKGAYTLALRITRDGKTTMMYFETPVLISLN